jgi:hypothetical protein
LNSISRCQSSNERASTVAAGSRMIVLPPTALTRMSIRPSSRTTPSTAACTWAASSAFAVTPPGASAGIPEGGHDLLQAPLIGVDPYHGPAAATDDLGSCLADSAGRRRDERHLPRESHGCDVLSGGQ